MLIKQELHPLQDMELCPKEQNGQPKGTKNKQRNQAVSAIHGNIYQLKLLMLFMYRGVSLGYSFRLGTEIEEADKFDDLVFEYIQGDEKKYRILQAKHKLEESKKITAHNLLREKNGDYNLIKYLASYQSSKKRDLFKDGLIKDAIICTNIDFDFENLNRAKIKIEEIEEKDDILDIVEGKKQAKRYKFSHDLATLEEMTQFSTDEVKDFLDHLVFAVQQPNEEELGMIIKQELGKKFGFDLVTKEDVYNNFFVTMLNWFQGKERGKFLSFKEGKEFFERKSIQIWFGVKNPVASFVGRIEQLNSLHRILQSEDVPMTSPSVCISGLGGIGKSELARKYIREHSQDYDNKVIWINAENYQTLAKSFRRLACDKLEMSTKNANGEEKEMRSIVEEVYKFFSDGKSLFVFDNAEKYRSEEEFDHGIDTFLLPPPPNNKNKPHILITSRNQRWPKQIKVIILDAFTEKEAMQFIKNSLNVQNGGQDKEIKEMSKELQYFPLALQQAVSYITVQDEKMKNVGSGFQLRNYLDMFREKAEKLLKFKFPEDSDNAYTKTTYVTWNVTLDALSQKENGKDALEILNIISYLAPENIPIVPLLSHIGDEEELGSAIELLKQYSMIKSDLGKLSMHRLVQYVTRMKLEKENREEEILRNILIFFNRGNVNSETVDHAISILHYSSKYSELVKEYFNISFIISVELASSFRFEDAYLFGLKMIELITLKISEGDPIDCFNFCSTLNHISSFLQLLGKYDEAFHVLSMLLSLEKSIFGECGHHTLLTVNEIAVMISRRGMHKEALAWHQEILNHFKNMLGEQHYCTLYVKYCITVTLNDLGKFDEALEISKELYDIKYTTLGENHLQTLHLKSSIASLVLNKGNVVEALKMYQEVLNDAEANLNKNNPFIFWTKKKIAMLLAHHGMLSAAFQIYEDVLSVEKVRLGEEHPVYLSSRSEFGEILTMQGKYREALENFEDILNKMENIPSYEHLISDTLHTKCSKAKTLSYLGNHDEALRIYQEVLSQRKIISGDDAVATLNCYFCIATTLLELGQYDKALEQYRDLQRRLGDNHFTILESKSVNVKDDDGKTILHYAIQNGYIDIINILTKSGADVTLACNKGETALHLATAKGFKEIVENLLQCVSRRKLNEFVDAKIISDGTTSLHIAAKKGFTGIVIALLKHGASYNIRNKDGKTPLELSKKRSVTKLLESIAELFEDAKNGKKTTADKLKVVKPDKFPAVVNARNNQGHTLLQVAIANKHKGIANELLQLLR